MKMKDWIEQGRRAGSQLLAIGDSFAGSSGELTDRLGAFSDAEAEAMPFIEGAPARLESLRDGIAAGLPEGRSIAEVLGDPESEASREVRSLYRIALDIARQPDAREIAVDLSAAKAFRALEANFSGIATDLTAHLQEFGWVRAAGTGLDLLSTREVMQRIQMALLRWNAETIALAADPPEPKGPGVPEGVEDLLADYRAIRDAPAFSPALPVKAKWQARLFFGEVATVLECPLQLVLNTPSKDLLSAIDGGTAGLSEPEVRPAIAGASVSLGRAVGRVRVILNADEGESIRVGDIVVTDLSTPTYEGQPSIFPYRTVSSVPIDKAAAIVTDEGGLLSHAAIVCRENTVPAILGAEGASATLKDGMIVEVDATRANGTITILH
jgi:phosphohistidine swiveling domain-containing protein